MIKVEFNNIDNYLYSSFEGEITKKNFIDYIDATRLNKSYPRKLKILTDSTRANMILSRADLELVIEANIQSLQHYDFIIDAIITSYPKETAYSMLYKRMSAMKNYRFEVFSTKEAAIKWLSSQ
ncbi:MAG: hypothetical protein PF485_15390 [Bacteroidales bacterium]|jgi:hypothetical protein|nr:hypothetical protein [Bacteroidales bacterium]